MTSGGRPNLSGLFTGSAQTEPGRSPGTLRPVLLTPSRESAAGDHPDQAPNPRKRSESAAQGTGDLAQRWPGFWGLVDPVLLATGYFTLVQAAVDLQRRMVLDWAHALQAAPRRLAKDA